MKVRSTRVVGALIATVLVAPFGMGLAVADDDVLPPSDESATEQSVDDTASATDANESADEVTDSEGDAADLANLDNQVIPAQGEAVEIPEVAPAPATPSVQPFASIDLTGVDINGLVIQGSAWVEPPAWRSNGVYSARVEVEDVIGLDHAQNVLASDMIGDVTYEYVVNGDTLTAITLDADNTFQATGLVEGENTIGVVATYSENPNRMLAVGNGEVTVTVPGMVETVSAAQADNTASSTVSGLWTSGDCGTAPTLTVADFNYAADAGFFDASAPITLFVFDADYAIVDQVSMTAAADGSLEGTYATSDLAAGTYFFYFESLADSAVNDVIGTYELTVTIPTAPAVVACTTSVSSTAAAATSTTGTSSATLATTGSESSTGLIAAILAIVLGAGTVAAVAGVRRRLAAQA